MNGRKEYRRSCHFENVDDSKDACVSRKTPPNIENHFCETCHTDGCKFVLHFLLFFTRTNHLLSIILTFQVTARHNIGQLLDSYFLQL